MDLRHSETLLQKAIMEGDIEALKFGLERLTRNKSPDISRLLIDLLHFSVEWDRVEMAEILIAARAPVDGGNGDGETPLMHAVSGCQICLSMLQFLVDAGADADAENNGFRVIDYAERADVPEGVRSAALEIIWKAPRIHRVPRGKKK